MDDEKTVTIVTIGAMIIFTIFVLVGHFWSTEIDHLLGVDETNPYYKAVRESRGTRSSEPILPKTITDNCGVVYTFPLKFDVKCAAGYNSFRR